LFITFFLWFIIQLAKPYAYSATINLNVINVPNQISIDTTNIKLGFEVEAVGFKLWTYNLSKKSIDLDYKVFEKKPEALIISASDIKSIINKKDILDSKRIEFLETSFSIPYTIKDSKTVPVVPRVDYQFADGYNTFEDLKVNPDSVVITGSKKELAMVSEIYTLPKKIVKANQDLEGTISLASPNENIKLSAEEVVYSLSVQKFSEKSIEAQINVKNVPDSLNLSIYPQKAKLSFLVSLESFDKVTELDFKIACDFNKRYTEEAIMIPLIESMPDEIKNVKLQTKKVDYLLVKN